MNLRLAHIALLVNDYDEAIAFYTNCLGFRLQEDVPLSPEKRWVIMAPPGEGNCSILLAKAANDHQRTAVGNQSGGRVFLFLHTDDFDRDYLRFRGMGIHFVREPALESYGKVAVFSDLYGNLWDLIQPNYPANDAAPG